MLELPENVRDAIVARLAKLPYEHVFEVIGALRNLKTAPEQKRRKKPKATA